MKLKVFFAFAMLALSAGAAQAATNLVVNGDFSQGNTGFTSDYRYVAPTSGAMMPETVYTVTSDPHSVHPYWVQLNDNKPLLLVNGATSAGLTVWRESIATVSGKAYSFSASAANVCCNSAHPGDYAPSELEFEVSSNGFATFQTLATLDTQPLGDAGKFATVSASFTATGPMEIRIIDALTGRVGNDFAVGDVSVTALADPTQGKVPSGPSAVGAVPEPAQWALMVIGFGGLGAALRTRRRAAALA